MLSQEDKNKELTHNLSSLAPKSLGAVKIAYTSYYPVYAILIFRSKPAGMVTQTFIMYGRMNRI